MASVESEFQAAADSVKTFTPSKSVSNADKLKAYALFKQATVGDVNIERPGMFSMEGRAKWDAWNDVKGMAKEDAMKQYTAEIKRQQAEYA